MSEGAEAGSSSAADVYVRQLREIFLASDSSGSGFLNRDDLQRLCRRLNLEADVSKRITDSLCVTSDDRRCVGFDQFKETFVNVLTESEQTTTADDGDKIGHLGSGDQTENAIDLSEEERHLLGIWKELGVGANGSLSLAELHQVCHFLNMTHMTNKDVEQLFAKLDIDGDGFVSFGELLHGLFEIGELSHPEPSSANPSATPVLHAGRTLSLPLENPYDQRSIPASSSHSLHAHEGILAFLNKEGSGFAKSEKIVELWESLGIKEGHLILKLLRFDVKRSISLLDLSLVLVDEIHAIEVDNNIVYQAALCTVEHALDYLHCTNEDLRLERDRLIADLSAMRKRNAAIVEEFDELNSSTEEQKTNDRQVAALEAKYQRVLIQLKQQLDNSDQLQCNLNATEQEVNSLTEKLHLTEKAKDALELELFHVSEKCCSLEKELEQKEVDDRLQQQQQQELRDRLEAQTIYLNDLMHQLSNEQRTLTAAAAAAKERPGDFSLVNEEVKGDVALTKDIYETELQILMRGMSMERKDIEGAFRLEITELEERHLDQLSALKKEFEKEKDELISGHKRQLAEAVAERERDLLNEFLKETGQNYAKSAELKELEERLRLAQQAAEERGRYALELEAKLSTLEKAGRRSPEGKSDLTRKQPDESVQPLDDDDDVEEMMHSRDELLLLMERVREEKQKMEEKANEQIATIRHQHKQDLAKLSNDLIQDFHLERDKADASFVSERRKLEDKIYSMENDLLKKGEEKEQCEKELEKELHKKAMELVLCRKELEEQLHLKEAEKELYRPELERKEEEKRLLKSELEEELRKKEREMVLHRTELERRLRKKEEEKQLIQNELEEEKQLIKTELEEERQRKALEKELFRSELERDRRREEEERDLREKELERNLSRKEEENDLLRREMEKLKQLNERIEEQKTWKAEEEEEPTRDGTDRHLKDLQIDELCRKNVLLKDQLEKRDGELMRLRQELDQSRQMKRDHLTGSGDHPPPIKAVAMGDLRDVVMERDLLKHQLQLTVKQLAEAASALSLLTEELRKEKEMATRVMVDRRKYEDIVKRLCSAEAKAHQLQHDCDFRAAETTKLLSLSQTVSKQKLNHLMEENVKLEKQLKQRKRLINDQLTTIANQGEELVKSDALIRDLYIENAHLVRCLQKTEGNRQDSDVRVQVLHQKCLDLGRLLSTVGPLAFNHH